MYRYGQEQPYLFITDSPVADKDYFLEEFPSLQIYKDKINKEKEDIFQYNNNLALCTITSNQLQIAISNNDMINKLISFSILFFSYS